MTCEDLARALVLWHTWTGIDFLSPLFYIEAPGLKKPSPSPVDQFLTGGTFLFCFYS